MTDLYVQAALALALVIGLIYLLSTFLKKRQEKDSLMKVMGYQSLGPKKGIAMVKIGSEVLLVGVTATDVKLLKTLESREEEAAAPAEGRATVSAAPATVADITDKLKKLRALKDTLYAVK